MHHALEWWFNGGPFATPWFGVWTIVGVGMAVGLYLLDKHERHH